MTDRLKINRKYVPILATIAVFIVLYLFGASQYKGMRQPQAFFNLLINNAFLLVTSIGMFGTGAGWGIPVPNHSLQITLGGIAEKPGVVDHRIEVREYLSVTISFDHDVIDGAPAARFIQQLKEFIEDGYGLED